MYLTVALLLVGSASAGKRQKPDDAACPGLPADQRPSLAVGELSPQVPVPGTVAVPFAGRLRTRLLSTGCFALDLENGTGRYRIGAIVSDYQDEGKATALQINGETTVMYRARLGLVITLTDTQTDRVLVTEVVETEGKERVIPSRKTAGTYGGEVSAAMAAALDAAITDVTRWMVPWRERLDVAP